MNCRIAMISEHASPLASPGSVDAGGQNIYVANTARELAAIGYRVDVFTRRDAEDLPEIVEWRPGVRVIHVPAGPAQYVRKEKLLEHMTAFADFVIGFATGAANNGDPYHLTHAHFFMSGLVAQRLRCQLAIPYVVTFHALGRVRLLHQGHDDFPEQRAALEQLVMNHAAAVIAECPQDADDLLRHYRIPKRRIAMVPCGFDPAEITTHARAAARVAIGLDPERPVVLHLGRLVPRKGIATIIRAMAVLRREHACDPLLVVVGGNDDGPDPARTPEIARLQQIAEQERVAASVRFTGRRARHLLAQYYAAADVFVTTPWYEPFGITVVEAMAAGLPVIGSRVGGIQYTVQDGVTGFLVPPRDPTALARRLGQLLASPSLCRMFGRRGRRRAYQHFTWNRIARQLDALYVRTTVSEIPASSVAGAL
jgi:D-inositol-3-phosphate glycosyltransferase